MSTLFEAAGMERGAYRPLADRLRPARLEQVVGQEHLIADDAPLGRMLSSGRLGSILLWGPPGCGKTTIARLLAEQVGLQFEQMSAIFSGVADLKKAFETARARSQSGLGTLLFVDEIHRFNKSQQDSFLPVVEDGTIVLVGATTENPSFELNAALLSRCQVLVLNRLDEEALTALLDRAEAKEDRFLPLDAEARIALCEMADGDGRFLLNMAEELLSQEIEATLNVEQLGSFVQRRLPVYDKAQDGHYNLISALHKSLRGSDTDAALYWLARMLNAGENPLYIARRLIRFANEDIGLADPEAIHQALAAQKVYETLGSPEGELALAQCVIYLGTAPKSNAAYKSFGAAMRAAKQNGSLSPPKHILNAPTKLMKEIGYGEGYEYDHDTEDGFSGQDYFPEGMKRERFYRPVERGFERDIAKRLAYWDKLRQSKKP